MKPLKVIDIQRGCVYDGPGIRTTVFLKGCVFNCPWCCNPESISIQNEFFIYEEKCLKNKNIHSSLCSDCERNSGCREIDKCPFDVKLPVSREYTPSELSDELLKDKQLYETSGGGVTFSGGEPLLYAEELLPVLTKLKEENISIYFESTIAVTQDKLRRVLPFISGIFVDLKLQDEMDYQLNAVNWQNITLNIDLLEKFNIDIKFRMVFIDSVLQIKDKIYNKLKDLNISKIELLGCHNLASKKYSKLGKGNYDFTATEALLESFSLFLKSNGIASDFLMI